MTLVEVMVALVILGTLLVSAITARGRYLRQAGLAQQKRAAIVAADAMLAEWWRDPSTLPLNATGIVPGRERFGWKTKIVERDGVEALGAQVLSVEIVKAQTTDRVMAISSDQKPLVSFELLVPIPNPSSIVTSLAGLGGSDASH